MSQGVRRGGKLAGVILGIVLVIWLPRGVHLDRQLTPDEPFWLAMSGNFTKGIVDGRLSQTYQYPHPGVTTMWAGFGGYMMRARSFARHGPERVRQNNNEIAKALTSLGISPLETVAAGRRVVAVFITLALAGTAWYAVRLFGAVPGLMGGVILATDPFHVALSRLLHVDGLFSSFLGLAAVAWLAYLADGRKQDLVVAGIAIGLAGLTRSIAAVLLPMIVLSGLIEGGCGGLWGRSKRLLILGGTALATFVALWPAIWVSPVSTATKFVRDGLAIGGQAHPRPIFFNGRIYTAVDPGYLFYPVSFAWRTTPVMLLGLSFAIVSGVFGLLALVRDRRRPASGRWALYLSILTSCVFVVLELSAKKLDRYVIAMVPPLAIIAGWGYGVALAWLDRRLRAPRRRRAMRIAFGVSSSLLILVNLVSVVRTHPYGLDYYNPLLGGASAAKSDMMLGWGEGLDQIGATIASNPAAADVRVLTTSWLTSLNYFTGATPVVQADFSDPHAAFVEWVRSDYCVWYVTADQRGYITPEVDTYLAGLKPVKTVRLVGVDYAKLYDLRAAPLPPFFADQMWLAPAGSGLRLVTATLNDDPVPPGDEVTAVLYVTGRAPAGSEGSVRLTLTGPSGETVAGPEQSFHGDDTQTIWSVRRRVTLPTGAQLGTWWVTADFAAGAATSSVVLGPVTVRAEAATTTTPTPEPDDQPLDEGG